MKIGLVTLFNYNYGSALQCFSTQRYIQDNYGECVLIDKQRKGTVHSRLRTIALLCQKCITSPGSVRSIISHFQAQRSGGLKISNNSLREIERFVICYLNKKRYSYNTLKSIATTEEYNYFFTGSDQVWNGASVLGHDMFFLRFAPQNKRIAWAPSFGSGEVSIYNKRSYTKYLSQFQALSVREQSGEKIIERLIGEKADILCDPVILFTGDQWRAYYSLNASFDIDTRYICLFFIDQISEKALSFIRQLAKTTGLKMLSFGYHYDSYDTLDNYTHYDGSPFDFLKCIDNAEIVITDSFHATIYSLLFHTNFYSFTRSYTHGQNQSSRITDLLMRINAMERFDSSEMKFPMDFSFSDEFFQNEKAKMDAYLERNLGNKMDKNEIKVQLYDFQADCCGCGACADICVQNAITMTNSNRGSLPVIDYSSCIGCKRCLNVCGLKRNRDNIKEERKAYIGKGKDSDTIKGTASGGIFASIACSILNEGGVVYGAALYVNDGICDCKHIRVDKKDDLCLILNSKYVQSKTDGIYKMIRNDLKQGKRVLFSGTSCQVASLKEYLEENEKINLYTVDLICHGVPSIQLLQDYVDFIQKEKNAKVLNIRFRNKNKDLSPFAPYIMTIELDDKFGRKTEYISLRNSSYYRLFMGMAGYRYSCYKCKFANINKPADITLGDYYLSENNCSFFDISTLDKNDYYSCVICHTNKGSLILSDSDVELYEIPIEQAIIDHSHLQYASIPTRKGERLLNIYEKKGFAGLQKHIDRENKLIDCVKKFRN